mgnify:CR=1 FL=1
MRLQSLIHLTPEQYLFAERQSDTKSEYFDGAIFAMSGASREHNQISANLVRVLGNQLLDKPCSVYSSDMKVWIDKARKYTYPDLVIVCQTERFEDEHRDVLLNPVVILEILSDSTEAYDRGRKFLHDQLLDSLIDYLLVSQDTPRIEVFSRRENNAWLYAEFHGLDAVVEIKSIGCGLDLGDIYHKVDLLDSIG